MTNTVPSDLDIAKAATVQPVVEIAESVGLTADDLITFGADQGKGASRRPEASRHAADGQIHRRDCGNPDAVGGGQDHDHRRAGSRLRGDRSQRHRMSSATKHGAHVRDQRRRRRGGYSQVVPMDEFTFISPGTSMRSASHTTSSRRRSTLAGITKDVVQTSS